MSNSKPPLPPQRDATAVGRLRRKYAARVRAHGDGTVPHARGLKNGTAVKRTIYIYIRHRDRSERFRRFGGRLPSTGRKFRDYNGARENHFTVSIPRPRKFIKRRYNKSIYAMAVDNLYTVARSNWVCPILIINKRGTLTKYILYRVRP